MKHLSESFYQFAQVMTLIEENEGEITDEMLPMLTKAELTMAQRIDEYVNLYDSVKAQIEHRKKIIEKFKNSLQILEQLETRLKENVKHLMQHNNVLCLEGSERTIKLVNAGGVQSTQKPDDMFLMQECINPKYLLELDEYVEERLVYVIKDKEMFKEAIKENKIPSCFVLPRGKYVKFI